MITIAILRTAGLTDQQIAKVAEIEERERLAARREQNRQASRRHHEKKVERNQRSSQQSSALRAETDETKTDVALPKAPDRFDELWAAYPKRGGASNPKKPAREKFERAVKAGADPDQIIAAAKRYHEIERNAGRAGTDKIAQMMTWLNQQRWNDYPGTNGADHPTGVHIKADTPEWNAWCGYLRQHGRKTPPTDKSGGWRFDTLWPPDHVAPQEGMH